MLHSQRGLPAAPAPPQRRALHPANPLGTYLPITRGRVGRWTLACGHGDGGRGHGDAAASQTTDVVDWARGQAPKAPSLPPSLPLSPPVFERLALRSPAFHCPQASSLPRASSRQPHPRASPAKMGQCCSADEDARYEQGESRICRCRAQQDVGRLGNSLECLNDARK